MNVPEAPTVPAPRRPGRPLLRISLLALPLLLGFFALPGCDETYDVHQLYPLRHDWIVAVESLEGNPPQIDPPGMFPLQMLDGRSGLSGLGDDLIKARDAQKIVDPRTVLNDDRTAGALNLALRDLAGRPRNPKINTGDDVLNKRLETELKLDRKSLDHGSVVYRRQCLHCHGVAGDGKGPTGPWINPHPRDFRSGAFKFTSSQQQEGERKPRRDDLRRVLQNGIDGSAMPSFVLLPPEDMEAVLSYVIHLSIRGEVEMETLKELILEKTQGGGEDTPMYERTRKWAVVAATRWLAAPAAEIKPAKVPSWLTEPSSAKTETERLEAAVRGYEFFTQSDQCVKCHTNFGRDAENRYDSWGTIVRPRNFQLNRFAGGRRPLDLFYRIHSGIKGSGMPALPTDPKDKKGQPLDREATIWNLVAFIQTLPYPEERAKLRKFNILVD